MVGVVVHGVAVPAADRGVGRGTHDVAVASAGDGGVGRGGVNSVVLSAAHRRRRRAVADGVAAAAADRRGGGVGADLIVDAAVDDRVRAVRLGPGALRDGVGSRRNRAGHEQPRLGVAQQRRGSSSAAREIARRSPGAAAPLDHLPVDGAVLAQVRQGERPVRNLLRGHGVRREVGVGDGTVEDLGSGNGVGVDLVRTHGALLDVPVPYGVVADVVLGDRTVGDLPASEGLRRHAGCRERVGHGAHAPVGREKLEGAAGAGPHPHPLVARAEDTGRQVGHVGQAGVAQQHGEKTLCHRHAYAVGRFALGRAVVAPGCDVRQQRRGRGDRHARHHVIVAAVDDRDIGDRPLGRNLRLQHGPGAEVVGHHHRRGRGVPRPGVHHGDTRDAPSHDHGESCGGLRDIRARVHHGELERGHAVVVRPADHQASLIVDHLRHCRPEPPGECHCPE